LSKAITSAVEKLVQPWLDDSGFELVDIEYLKEGGNWFLRVIVDKEGGIDIEDCSRISEFVSEMLDKADPISDAYFLEVTSPGAERPLKKPDDFIKALNSNVYVTTYEPVNGHKEFEGILEAYDENQLVIRTGKTKHVIPTGKMAGARLAVVF
jgi:ribosome maturation factor RimP